MDMDAIPPYDPRYLAGIVLFNRGDFFEAHEVWESLWMETFGPERKFYQALIQAAVGILHFCNGNVRGAAKLYRSSREYMHRYGSPFLGLNQEVFWGEMDRCFAELVATPEPPAGTATQEELIPEIALDPAPETWPAPAQFVEHDEEDSE
jgi:predicted metal-dependent hydrolase